MYERPFQLEIVTPQKVVFKGEATSLSAPGVTGAFQVLHSHAPLLSALEVGELKVRDTQGAEVRYATSGGFVEVKNNKVVVLAETAERSAEIDVARATAARERAEARLRSRSGDLDVERARISLARAINRLRVASRA
jgi:F-type H+-transporting ATPase subunit epsilon